MRLRSWICGQSPAIIRAALSAHPCVVVRLGIELHSILEHRPSFFSLMTQRNNHHLRSNTEGHAADLSELLHTSSANRNWHGQAWYQMSDETVPTHDVSEYRDQPVDVGLLPLLRTKRLVIARMPS